MAYRLARKRWLRWAARVLAALFALGVVGYIFRAPLLIGAARAWVINDPVTKADAIVILGGGPETRPFAAAKLYHQGVAPKVLYMNVKLGPAEELGVVATEPELTRRILLSNGVPESAQVVLGTNVANTFDESRAVRDWARQTGASSIVITTDLFHTRRARWIFNRELHDKPIKINVVAVEPIRFKMTNWWQHEDGLVFFQNEIIKYAYYRLKY